MVDFISDKNILEELSLIYNSLFKDSIEFIANPFQDKYDQFLAFEFDFIFEQILFDPIIKLTNRLKKNRLFFYTIEPSPTEYFFKHFKKYNSFEFSVKSDYADVADIISKNPGFSPADSILFNSRKVALFSESDDWAILGLRDWEMAVIGFKKESTKEIFIDYTDKKMEIFFSLENYFDDVCNLQIEQEKIDLLIKNFNVPSSP